MDITDEVKEHILKQAFFRGKIVSDSMVPVINVGEEILIDVKCRDLKRFDIIVYVHDQKLICHYLWKINQIFEPRLMQTRNMQGQKDYPISDKEYVGKVVSHRLRWWQILKIIFWK